MWPQCTSGLREQTLSYHYLILGGLHDFQSLETWGDAEHTPLAGCVGAGKLDRFKILNIEH